MAKFGAALLENVRFVAGGSLGCTPGQDARRDDLGLLDVGHVTMQRTMRLIHWVTGSSTVAVFLALVCRVVGHGKTYASILFSWMARCTIWSVLWDCEVCESLQTLDASFSHGTSGDASGCSAASWPKLHPVGDWRPECALGLRSGGSFEWLLLPGVLVVGRGAEFRCGDHYALSSRSRRGLALSHRNSGLPWAHLDDAPHSCDWPNHHQGCLVLQAGCRGTYPRDGRCAF